MMEYSLIYAVFSVREGDMNTDTCPSLALQDYQATNLKRNCLLFISMFMNPFTLFPKNVVFTYLALKNFNVEIIQ